MVDFMAKESKNSFGDSLKAICRNRDFQVVMAEMLERCNVFAQPFSGNSRDIFHAGRRSVALEMLDEIRAVDESAAVQIIEGVIKDD